MKKITKLSQSEPRVAKRTKDEAMPFGRAPDTLTTFSGGYEALSGAPDMLIFDDYNPKCALIVANSDSNVATLFSNTLFFATKDFIAPMDNIFKLL